MTDENYIALICNGGFDVIPDISIGELFEAYFDNINYNVIKENDTVFVDFTGVTLYENKEENILIRFFINPNNEEFAITEVKVGDKLLEEDDVIELLEDIEFVGKTILDDEITDYDEIDDYIDDENDIYFESDFNDKFNDINEDYDNFDDNDDNDDNDNNGNNKNNDDDNIPF